MQHHISVSTAGGSQHICCRVGVKEDDEEEDIISRHDNLQGNSADFDFCNKTCRDVNYKGLLWKVQDVAKMTTVMKEGEERSSDFNVVHGSHGSYDTRNSERDDYISMGGGAHSWKLQDTMAVRNPCQEEALIVRRFPCELQQGSGPDSCSITSRDANHSSRIALPRECAEEEEEEEGMAMEDSGGASETVDRVEKTLVHVRDDSALLRGIQISSSSSSSSSSGGVYKLFRDEYPNRHQNLVQQEEQSSSSGENTKKVGSSSCLLNLCKHVKRKSQQLFTEDSKLRRSSSSSIYTEPQRLLTNTEFMLKSNFCAHHNSTANYVNGKAHTTTTTSTTSCNDSNNNYSEDVLFSTNPAFHHSPTDTANNNNHVIKISTTNVATAISAHDSKLDSTHLFLGRCKSSCTEFALESLRFISKTTESDLAAQWKDVENRFYELASSDGLISRRDFGYCIGMKDSHEFACELFDALARRQGFMLQFITLEELRDFWIQISDQSFCSRIQIFFDMCDKNADGRITEEEVKEVIALSASANNLSKLKDQADEYAALIMEELDPDNLGYIELWQFEALLQLGQDCNLCGQDAAANNYSQTLSQTSVVTARKRRNAFHRMWLAVVYALDEKWQRWWVMGLWIVAMLGLFTWKFLQYRQRASFQIMGYCVCTAKGAAETLKLNMALILLPVCRNSITWLRSTFLTSILPFDDNINFHKAIAVALAVGVMVHAGIHMACDFPRLIGSDNESFHKYLGSDFGNVKPTYVDLVKGVEGVTGVLMVLLMVIAFVLASRWFRRNLVKLPWPLHRMTGFNAFWYSHHLFAILYVLLILHSQYLYLNHDWRQKTTWMYLAVPVLLYMGERILRTLRAGYYTVTVVQAAVYPGNVLALHMTKPPGFKYKSGMYTFLQCPDVSPFEWHPFSLTSAPGDDVLSVHIRTCGDWTLEMKRIFSEMMEPPLVPGKSGLVSAESKIGVEIRFPRLRIDGPYGAPAQDYKKYDVLLLVGLGIGATPFISILKNMLYNIKLADQPSSIHDSSNSCTSNFSSSSSINSLETTASTMKSSSEGCIHNVKKNKKYRCPTNAYFYWVTREQGSFEWFRGVMDEVAEKDNQAVIEMHNYLTSVYEDGDARSALIMMIQSLHHAKNGVDIVSGTRVRTHFARPNWKKVFSRVANIHKGSTIGVFYCGPLMVAKELENLVKTYNHSSSTRFEFHKENF